MDKPLLSVQNLRVRYGEMEALRGISFQVEEGDAVAIIGANGAGKSTMLKAIMGLIAPAGGTVHFGDRSLLEFPPWARAEMGISWVPEGRRIFPGLTVEENLLAGGYRRRDREGVRRELERVYTLFPRLMERAGQMGHTLSGGEQQMCALGRALMTGPRLLLIDEASLGLAPIFVSRLFDTIGELIRQGLTLLLVEQNARQALKVVERAYVLETGRIVKAGTSEALAADPVVRQAYLGS